MMQSEKRRDQKGKSMERSLEGRDWRGEVTMDSDGIAEGGEVVDDC